MGFPQWTIWGMALCLLLTLIVLGYSLNVQSPRRGAGFQMEPYRREARVRALTVTAFALLLVMVGFFVAGVPIGGQVEPVVENVPTQSAQQSFGASVATANTPTPVPEQTPLSGAFGQALPQESEAGETSASDAPAQTPIGEVNADEANSAEVAVVETAPEQATEPSDETEGEDVSPTATPLPPTETPLPEPTNTPAPTNTPTTEPTPTPTLTPTPISGETARVNTDGSTLWVKRSPGGQNVVIVQDGELLILLPGNANQAGVSWQQIKTVSGIEGWVERQFLAFPNTDELEE